MSFLLNIKPYDPMEKYKVVQIPQLEKDTPTVVFKSKPSEPKPKREIVEEAKPIPPAPVNHPVLQRQEAVVEEKKKGPKNPRFKAGTEEAKEWSKMMIDKRREAKERKLKVEQETEKPVKSDENENLVFKSK